MPLTRPQTRRRLCCTAVSLLLGAAGPAFALDAVAPGVWVHFGRIALPTPEDAGDIANLGVIVGEEAAAVIDTGGSPVVGRRLLAALRRVTERPLRYVINTHAHPDHVFGNVAFADTGAAFVGHYRLPQALAERGPYYLRSYRDQLGPAAIAETRIIPPSVLVRESATLDLGGRVLRLAAAPTAAHSTCDLTVLDTASGTLFAGDLLFSRHVPVLDGSLKGWLALLSDLAASSARRAVPGHGGEVLPWPAGLDDERRYLATLAADARRLIAAGVPLARAVPEIGAAERARWALFDDYAARDATVAYSELEWE
jgi:quinoprotein relay system zinc metallohydrolase 2